MYKAEFEVEAITPIFMRGADQRKAEIRASSIKGLMRWWFRALAGSYFSDDVVGLKKVEDYVFGSTGGKSRVVVEVSDVPEPYNIKKVECRIRYDARGNTLKPKMTDISLEDTDGKTSKIPNYLFFSIKMLIEDVAKETLNEILAEKGIRNKFRDQYQMETILRKRGLHYPSKLEEIFKDRFIRLECYPAGTTFKIKIKSYDKDAFELALSSLWLLSNFGGIGFRSRKGAGSIMARLLKRSSEFKEQIERLFSLNWENIDAANSFWDNSIKRICQKIGLSCNGSSSGVSLYPNICELVVLESTASKDNWFEAVQELEKIYAGELKKGKNCIGKLRRRYEGGVRFKFADRDDPNCKDFSHVVVRDGKDLKDLGRETHERRFYFGLPLIFSNWKIQIEGHNQKNPKKPYSRRASSIILTVKKRNGEYLPMVVIIPYQFLPSHEGKFAVIKRDHKNIIQITKNGRPTNNEWFIDWLKNDVVKRFEQRGFIKVYP